MVVEGVRFLTEAQAAHVPTELVLYDPRTAWGDPRIAELVARAAESGIRTIEASRHVIAACSQLETPPGVLAVVSIPSPGLPAVLERDDLLLVVVDRVQDPGNLGTIVRVADAAGASAVAVTRGSVDPCSPKAVRATMGSLFHLPVVEVERDDLMRQLRERGVRILVADQRGTQNYVAASYAPPVAVVLGGEAAGVHPQWRETATALVRIPLYGRAESLNVAIAAALLLYEARRAREV